MRHETARFYLEGYDRDDLGDSLKARIDRHAAECASCAAEADRLTPLKTVFSEMAQSLPAGFDQAIERTRQETLRRVRLEPQAPRLLAGWLAPIGRWSLAAPMAVAAALLVLVIVSPQRRESISPAPRASAPLDKGSVPAPQASPAPGMIEAPVVAAATPMVRDGRANFVVLRKGQDVRIEWLRNGHSHQIRKSDSPAGVAVARAQTVTGSEWRDSSERPAPGSVTYYLVD